MEKWKTDLIVVMNKGFILSTGVVDKLWKTHLPVEKNDKKTVFHFSTGADFSLSLWKCGKLCLSIDIKSDT